MIAVAREVLAAPRQYHAEVVTMARHSFRKARRWLACCARCRRRWRNMKASGNEEAAKALLSRCLARDGAGSAATGRGHPPGP